MTAVWDTGAAIRAIDSMSVEECAVNCWCRNPSRSPVWAMNWFPGEPILRFPPPRHLESEAA